MSLATDQYHIYNTSICSSDFGACQGPAPPPALGPGPLPGATNVKRKFEEHMDNIHKNLWFSTDIISYLFHIIHILLIYDATCLHAFSVFGKHP
jgi:hypothetical protein